MKVSHSIQLVVFILFIDTVFPFIFRSSSQEDTNNNRLDQNVLKKQNSHHQIVFPPSFAIVPNNTFTVKVNFFSDLPRLKTTAVPLKQLNTKSLNSTVQGNTFSEIFNSTATKLLNRTVENATESDRVVIENSEPDRCPTGHDQQPPSKQANYLSDDYIR